MARNKRRNGAKRRRSKATHEGLAPGTALTATLKGQTFSASVVVGPDRKPEIEFEGDRYQSPSAADRLKGLLEDTRTAHGNPRLS